MHKLASKTVGEFWEWLKNRESKPAESLEPLQLELPMPPRQPTPSLGDVVTSTEPDRGVFIIDLGFGGEDR